MRVRRWLPPLAWAGVILFANSLPGSSIPSELGPYDKVGHLTLYGIFAVLLSRSAAEATDRWRAALLAVAIAVAFGAGDEWHQRFIPGRASEVADWEADSLGALGGAIVFALYTRIRQSRPTTS